MIVNIGNNEFIVKTMVSPIFTQMGMQGRTFDDTFNGMLFLMSNGPHCFWMKNCVVHLDIIFINNNIIKKIHHNCPPCEDDSCDERYCGEGDLVLELAGGDCKSMNINEGDKIEFLF